MFESTCIIKYFNDVMKIYVIYLLLWATSENVSRVNLSVSLLSFYECIKFTVLLPLTRLQEGKGQDSPRSSLAEAAFPVSWFGWDKSPVWSCRSACDPVTVFTSRVLILSPLFGQFAAGLPGPAWPADWLAVVLAPLATLFSARCPLSSLWPLTWPVDRPREPQTGGGTPEGPGVELTWGQRSRAVDVCLF